MTGSQAWFAIISGLVINECSELSPWSARRLVRFSAKLRYADPALAAERSEELAALIDDRPGKLFKLFTAIGFTMSGLSLAGARTSRRLALRLSPSLLVVGGGISSFCLLIALCLYGFFAGVTSTAIGLGLAMAPVPFLLACVLLLDQLRTSWRDVTFTFLWGAGTAVLGALILNTLGYRFITAPIFGVNEGKFWTAAVGAPVIEESLKGSALLLLLWFRRNEIDRLIRGVVFASIAALGFAMMENISYYATARTDGPKTLEAVFLIRGVISPFGHPLFTAMTGLGIAYAITHQRRTRAGFFLLGLGCAMALHAAWNASGAFSIGGLLTVYAVDACVILAIAILIVLEHRVIVCSIERYLPLHLTPDHIAPAEIQMLSQLAARRYTRRAARRLNGRAGARNVSAYQQAAVELCLVLRRHERGATDQLAVDQHRDALIHTAAAARHALMPRDEAPTAAG